MIPLLSLFAQSEFLSVWFSFLLTNNELSLRRVAGNTFVLEAKYMYGSLPVLHYARPKLGNAAVWIAQTKLVIKARAHTHGLICVNRIANHCKITCISARTILHVTDHIHWTYFELLILIWSKIDLLHVCRVFVFAQWSSTLFFFFFFPQNFPSLSVPFHVCRANLS